MCCRLLIASLILVAAVAAASLDTRLVDAAKRKDVAQVRSLLQQHLDVNAASPDGATALDWAVRLDDLQTAKLLIDAGADVNLANRYGMTPLMLSATNGNAGMTELLLKAKADPNTRLPEGETVLMTAARTGNVNQIKTLLAHGSKVNEAEGWRGQTALMWAAAEGHVAAVETLIAAGADIHARSKSGFTPLLFAAREGKAEVVKALLKAGADVNETYQAPAGQGRGGPRASSGAFPGPANGSSVLLLAVANAHYELAAMLLDLGADPNAAGPGWTPLHNITWVRKLGQGNNSPSPQGSGKMDSLAFVRVLKAKGANLDARMSTRKRVGDSVLNTTGATAFLLACKSDDAELMRLLAELGADPKLPNADGSTPLMVAAGLGTRSPGEDAGTEAEALEAVTLALELGNDINAVDKNGETAMHGAAYKQFPLVVQLLADKGAKIEIWNRKNKDGWTPLRIAAGVFRTANFRFSDPTADALRKIMMAAGVSTELEPNPEVQSGEERTRPAATTRVGARAQQQ
jgi:ankyrin repeat protein